MSKLQKLSISTQKDEIIARLILQKGHMYVELTGGCHIKNILSKEECKHVKEYASETDRFYYNACYKDMLRLCNKFD